MVKIESNPSGANVFLDSKNIGATPLELASDKYADPFSKEYLDIRVEKAGHQSRSVLASTRVSQDFLISLDPYSTDYYEKMVLPNFQDGANKMTKEILTLQAMVMSKKYDQAEERLKKFIEIYPNIAAAYVLQANIESSKNNLDQAIKNLERASSIDPEDTVVKRMLESFRRSVPR
ncbi:hypothetical protein AZI86_01725 [Bdellovibrio bacteriovorus]|uniref:PEGA domain-containing protein n=1 Tax=Bdellovibrio bacteriovorus TaxID=959 RepID=A0A150WN48_BDEBC|nr:hypothetical protein AZI86_01725 [Bdellovibrio bacteriovorus]